MSDPRSHLSGPQGAGEAFWREVTPLYGKTSTTEASYYPAIKDLWSRILEDRCLPFEVRVSTAEQRTYAEVKLPEEKLPDIAFSTSQKNQVGRYLARTGS
jgi:hypothetical protein